MFFKLSSLKLNVIYNLLSAIGVLSLSWFFIHIIIFNEISALIGMRKFLNAGQTIFAVIITIILMAIFSVVWRRKELKFSLERAMRRFIKF